MQMSYSVLFLVSGLSLACAAASEPSPDKPEMNPPYPEDTLNQGIQDNVKPQKATTHPWNDAYLPQACLKLAQKYNLSADDFSAFDVKYDDCDQPWTFCHHSAAKFGASDMVQGFGSMPVRMRSYIRHFMGVPNLGNSAYAFTTAAGDTVFSGLPGPGVLAHEISHSIDFNAFPQYGSPFSKTPLWTDEYAKDTNTPKAYGRKNWLEDFAVTARVAFYDVNVPGGFAKIADNWQQIYHQYSTYEKYVGDIVKPGGTCGKRFPDSPKVKKDGSSRKRAIEARKTHGSIETIMTPPEYESMVMYNYDEEI